MNRTEHTVLDLHQAPCDPRARETTWSLVDFTRRTVTHFDAPLGGSHAIRRGAPRNRAQRTQRTTNGA